MLEPVAFIFLIGAPLLYGLNAVLLKKGVVGIPPFTAMSISMAVLLVVSIVFAMTVERPKNLMAPENRESMKALLWVGVVNAAAFWCFLSSYKYVSVWQYQMFALLIPIFSAIFAYYLLGETFSWRLFAGVGFMGAGLIIALR